MARNSFVLVFTAAIAFCYVGQIEAQYWCYTKVAASNVAYPAQVTCVYNVLTDGVNQVKNANCKACDKYFHCKAFKKAAATCGSNAKRIALEFGDCRAADEHDPADREANRFGANGGNCEATYLHICNKTNLCKWSPTSKTCSTANANNPSNAICKGLP